MLHGLLEYGYMSGLHSALAKIKRNVSSILEDKDQLRLAPRCMKKASQ
jgi:hypothetical protein